MPSSIDWIRVKCDNCEKVTVHGVEQNDCERYVWCTLCKQSQEE